MKLRVKYMILVGLTLVSITSKSQIKKYSSVYRISEMISTTIGVKGDTNVYINKLSYDSLGRPAISRKLWLHDKVPKGGSVFKYYYNIQSDRLDSIKTEGNKYIYSYDENGNLVKLTTWGFRNSFWQISMESIITREFVNDSTTKLISTLYWKKNSEQIRDSSNLYSQIEYLLDLGNNPFQSSVKIMSYKKVSTPSTILFVYDSNPNPLQQMFSGLSFDTDIKTFGPNNLVVKIINKNYLFRDKYEYNSFGYPTKVIQTYKGSKYSNTTTFAYNYFDVFTKSIDTINGEKAKEKQSISLLLYPNLAKSIINIKVENLTKGTSEIKIYDLIGKCYRKLQYDFKENNILEVVVPLDGMPKGTYILELTTANSRISKKFIVE